MVSRCVLALLAMLPFTGFCQVLEFKNVSRLPAQINTPAEETMPLLSPDGKRFFFSRALYEGNEGGEYAGQDVWVSEWSAAGWKKATNTIASINTKHNNVLVGSSADGKTLYFVNASPYQKMNGIYFVRRVGTWWNRPELIPIPGIDNLDFIGLYVSPDYDVILLSMKAPDARGEEDLYFTIKDNTGMWMKPQTLGATINTPGFEISPFLSADKKRLYFSSNGHQGEGDADIFYSERLYDSWQTWSVPVNLGPVVNSKKFDAYFSIYGDSIAYFASNRETLYADIYSVDVKQAKTVLTKGQRYLSGEEWNALVGKNVSADLVFAHRSSTLTASHKELIFYIVNKLMLERDINFHLVAKESEDNEITAQRIASIRDHLRQSGIDPGRIVETQVGDPQNSRRGIIEIRLFR